MKKTNDPGASAPTLSFYAALQRAYEHFNAQLFDSALPHCLITVQRERGTWGFFSAARWSHNPSGQTLHEIALNPAYFAHRSVLEVFQTLVHEMAHLWQHKHGRPSRARYHSRVATPQRRNPTKTRSGARGHAHLQSISRPSPA